MPCVIELVGDDCSWYCCNCGCGPHSTAVCPACTTCNNHHICGPTHLSPSESPLRKSRDHGLAPPAIDVDPSTFIDRESQNNVQAHRREKAETCSPTSQTDDCSSGDEFDECSDADSEADTQIPGQSHREAEDHPTISKWHDSQFGGESDPPAHIGLNSQSIADLIRVLYPPVTPASTQPHRACPYSGRAKHRGQNGSSKPPSKRTSKRTQRGDGGKRAPRPADGNASDEDVMLEDETVFGEGAGDQPQFACPFYKDNPLRYHQWDTCQKGYETFAELREHLTGGTSHHLLHECHTCLRIFPNQADLTRHSTSNESCQNALPYFPLEGISESTREKIEKLKPNSRLPQGDAIRRWKDIYRILFGPIDDDEMPSCFYHGNEITLKSLPQLHLKSRQRMRESHKRGLPVRRSNKFWKLHLLATCTLERQMVAGRDDTSAPAALRQLGELVFAGEEDSSPGSDQPADETSEESEPYTGAASRESVNTSDTDPMADQLVTQTYESSGGIGGMGSFFANTGQPTIHSRSPPAHEPRVQSQANPTFTFYRNGSTVNLPLSALAQPGTNPLPNSLSMPGPGSSRATQFSHKEYANVTLAGPAPNQLFSHFRQSHVPSFGAQDLISSHDQFQNNRFSHYSPDLYLTQHPFDSSPGPSTWQPQLGNNQNVDTLPTHETGGLSQDGSEVNLFDWDITEPLSVPLDAMHEAPAPQQGSRREEELARLSAANKDMVARDQDPYMSG